MFVGARLSSVAGFGVALLLCLGSAAPAETVKHVVENALTVCLPRNAGVVAGRRMTGGSGFDYLMAKALADALALDLKVVWYENELEEESDPLRQTYAMLAYGLCDAVPGHPRYAPALGPAKFDRAALPRWLGMAQEIDADTGLLTDRIVGYVDVQPIAVSQGYMRSEIGIAYRVGTAEPGGLGDLKERSLHLQQGTLSGVLAMMQTHPLDRANVTTHNPGTGFLWEVESGGGDLAILDVAAFDTHVKSNPVTNLRLADWRHPIGMDVGIAVLADNEALLAALDQALAAVPADQRRAFADEAGMTYAAPASDALMPELTTRILTEIR